jgi:hypothetical protein
MNPIRKWTIACYEFLFAEPGTAWRDVVEQVEADFEQRQWVQKKRAQRRVQAGVHKARLRSLEPSTAAIEVADEWETEPAQFPFSGFSIAGYSMSEIGYITGDIEYEEEYDGDYESESDLESETYGLVHYHIEALGGDTFIEFSYEGDLDEAAIMQALTYLWQTTPFRPNNQLVGTLQLPIAPAYSVQHLPFGF